MGGARVQAWGESCALGAPTYSTEHAAGIFCVIKEHFARLVVGKDFASSEDLQHVRMRMPERLG